MAQSRSSDGYLDDYLPDCPVQPEVWRRYRERGPGVALQLIVRVRPGDSPPMVTAKLRDWFETSELLTHGSYILVEATFEDMLTTLLPLTNWQKFVARAATLADARSRLLGEVAAVRLRKPLALPIRGGVNWGAADRSRLRWLIEMVAEFYDGDARVDDEAATTRILDLLVTAATAVSPDGAPLDSVGLNRPVLPAVTDSRATVKADAAERVFDLDCSGITWAVIDTGIDCTHPAFTDVVKGTSRVVSTFDVDAGIGRLKDEQKDARVVGLLDDAAWEIFRLGAQVTGKALRTGRSVDSRTEHGTHVAGILGAGYRRLERAPRRRSPSRETPVGDVMGICPNVRLVDIRVFDADNVASEFNVIVALAFVRWLNDRHLGVLEQRIDGVNISLSVPFAVDDHACGWTPVCQECDRLVKSGVVVVAAAGNAGFTEGVNETTGSGFAQMSISDPGNAEAVITVGSTHSHEPHRYGPAARSARGPTADGRHKPDLLAPGIRILGPAPRGGWQRLSGTSMAAPHVSGVAVLLLARFRELRGQPERVKEILCRTATDLGRIPDFQGHGLVDALRALQAP